MPHIFISYAKIDTRDLAMRLHAALNTVDGLSAWMDATLQTGESWATQIQDEIDRADLVLVLLSPDVNRKQTEERGRSFVLNEIDYAQQDRKPILPVMAQKTRVPVQIAGVQYVDVTGDADGGVARLVEAVSTRFGIKRPSKPPVPQQPAPVQQALPAAQPYRPNAQPETHPTPPVQQAPAGAVSPAASTSPERNRGLLTGGIVALTAVAAIIIFGILASQQSATSGSTANEPTPTPSLTFTAEATQVDDPSTPTPTATAEATEVDDTPTPTPTATLTPTPSATLNPEVTIGSVCLVTDVGRVNDGTFNQAAYEGMIRAAEDFGLDTTFIETSAPSDYAANIETCLDADYEVIITVGFLASDATLTAANAHPDVYFIGVDQFVQDGPANYVGIQYREDQAGFLAGAFAALISESGVIAGVYGFDIPPVVRYRNGFEQGARYVLPNLTILGTHLSSFIDAEGGAAAAEQFIAQGADVIFGVGGSTGSGAILSAAASGTFVIGVDVDQYVTTFGAGAVDGAQYLVTSAIKRVDNGVYNLLATLSGDQSAWVGGENYILSASNDGIGFAPAHDAAVPQAVIDQVNAIYAQLKNGTLDTGVDPVTGQLNG